MSEFLDGNKAIAYVYFDVDGRKIVKSYEELVKIYFKEVQTVYEMCYPCYISGQCLIAMSNKSEYSECTLRLILWRMWKKLHPENSLEKWENASRKT